jgi:hypothetical protein
LFRGRYANELGAFAVKKLVTSCKEWWTGNNKIGCLGDSDGDFDIAVLKDMFPCIAEDSSEDSEDSGVIEMETPTPV